MGIDAETDAQIVATSLQAPAVFAQLFDRHAVVVHRYARRRAGEVVADDVMAETFLVAFDRRHTYDLQHPDARPWLLGVATRLLARYERAEIRRWSAYGRVTARAPDLDDVGVDVDAIVGKLDAQSRSVELARQLGCLHQRDRDVLLLFGLADLTYEQIASALDIPVGTVRSRLNRARKLMQTGLNQPQPPFAANPQVAVPSGGFP